METLGKKSVVTISLVVALVHLTGLTLSAFFLWGWLTVSDLRARAKEMNRDWESLVDDLMTTRYEVKDKAVSIQTPDAKPLGQHALRSHGIFSRVYLREDGSLASSEFTSLEVNWLGLVLRLTDNALALVTALSVGYTMGIFKLLLMLRTKRPPRFLKLCALEPVLSALGAALLFLLICAGGALLWDDTSSFRRISLPLIAVIGALQAKKIVEKISRIALPDFGTEK
jgi:hypothetical protein